MSRIFTQNWFNPNSFKFFSKEGQKNYLEIGCFEGRSMCWMFDNVLTGDDDRAYALDPFDGEGEREAFGDTQFIYDNFVHNTREFEKKLTIYKGPSLPTLCKLTEDHTNFFDFIFIDGSHDSWDVTADAVLSFNLLKDGGIMGFDDYIWGPESPSTPQRAIDTFLYTHQDFLEVLHMSNEVWIKKTKSITH